MATGELLRAILIIGPIVAMIGVGLLLALRSGEARIASRSAVRGAVDNLSHTMLVVGGFLVGMVVLHQMVGLRVPLAW